MDNYSLLQEGTQYEFIRAPVELEDVAQEIELMALLGRRISRRLMMKKLSRSTRELLFGDWPEWIIPRPIGDWGEQNESENARDQLAQWARDTEDSEVFKIIHDFLETPCEESLDQTLSALRKAGISLTPKRAWKKSRSFIDLLRDQLRARPTELSELYDLARETLRTQRPEATVRQILRRLEASGEVVQTPRGWRLER